MAKGSVEGSDYAAVLKQALQRLSDAERRELFDLMKRAVAERDVQGFARVLLILKIGETSREYECLMSLWDEMTRASRHD